jgi:ABC-type sugar transport system permease subunit
LDVSKASAMSVLLLLAVLGLTAMLYRYMKSMA